MGKICRIILVCRRILVPSKRSEGGLTMGGSSSMQRSAWTLPKYQVLLRIFVANFGMLHPLRFTFSDSAGVHYDRAEPYCFASA